MIVFINYKFFTFFSFVQYRYQNILLLFDNTLKEKRYNNQINYFN